jgi:hypothetical protein
MRKYNELLGGRFRLTKVVVRIDHKDDDGNYQTIFENILLISFYLLDVVSYNCLISMIVYIFCNLKKDKYNECLKLFPLVII